MGRSALLAEDEDLLAEVIAWALEDAGFEVTIARNGDEAFKLSAGAVFDLLVTDIRMPGTLDGWALARRLREQHPDLPIVFASGFSPDSPQLPARSVYLLKPFRPEDLLTAVAQLLGPEL